MNNVQAEALMIGCILLDNSIMKEVALTAEHFYEPDHVQLFDAMRKAEKKGHPINVATIREELGELGFGYVGGQRYLKEMIESVPSVHGFKSYETFIITHWKQRRLKELLIETKDKIKPSEIQGLITELNNIDQVGMREVFQLQSHLTKMMDLINIETPKGMSGIPSGLLDLDGMTDGWQDEDSIIIGARPSMGKTAFALNLAIKAGDNDVIPIIFSLEMSSESLIKRMLSAIGEINGIKVRNPYQYFDDGDKAKWVKAIGVLGKINPQIFDKPRQTVNEMRAKVRHVKKSNPGKKVLVLIDYLTLIKPSSDYNGNTHAQVSEVSADLKTMAKEFKCPVITLAQLSRGVEARQNKRPMMSDLRESGSIEQDADVIGFLYRDEYYNESTPENRNVLEVDIAKQRNGPTGTINVMYKKEINKIENFYHYHNK